MYSKSTTTSEDLDGEGRLAIRYLFDRVYSKGDLGLINEITTQDFVGYSTEAEDTYHGPEGLREHVIRLRTAFFGFTMEIENIERDGLVWEVAWTARGTHERPFLGVEPTCIIGQAGEEPHGKRIAVPGISDVTVGDQMIRHHDMRWDMNRLRGELNRPTEHGVKKPLDDPRNQTTR
jgi:hypothetical protein